MNQISKVLFNKEGNQVLEEKDDGGGKTQTIKYGLIKLLGEKNERRVSYKTIIDIENAKKANFNGQITIPEINMSVHISQIVMMRSELENVRTEDKDYTKLPTVTITLDRYFNIINKTKIRLYQEQEDYYLATCHYKVVDGERQYYLDFNQIKNLVKVEFDADGYDFVSEIYNYGIKPIKK